MNTAEFPASKDAGPPEEPSESDSDSRSTLPNGVRPKPHSEILGGAPVARGEAVPRAGSAPLRVKVILALRDAPQAPLSVHLDSYVPPPRSRTLRAA